MSTVTTFKLIKKNVKTKKDQTKTKLSKNEAKRINFEF